MQILYSGNRMQSAEITADGADYEGRTGLPAYDSSGNDFTYDSNGNMTSDAVRGINRTRYNLLNLPEEITFTNGHRQTITYDGFGNKKRIDYAQGPETVMDGSLPVERAYAVTSSRIYAGSHVFADGQLEYSGFPGGYFDAEGSPHYYITDWQGNNAAVVNSSGAVEQNTDYYPYGEPTIEPSGQRYLFGGKEREHAAGLNSYDFGARSLTPYGIWPSPDPFAEKYYNLSPYSYCGGDPINNIDKWGLETLALSKDDSVQTYARNIPDDPNKLTIYSHGNYSGLDNDVEEEKGVIRNGAEFVEAIENASEDYKDIQNQIGLEIELKSCNAGAENPDGKPNIAEKISKALPNVFVTGPNGRVKTQYRINNGKVIKLKESIIDKKGIPIHGNEAKSTYFRGKKN